MVNHEAEGHVIWGLVAGMVNSAGLNYEETEWSASKEVIEELNYNAALLDNDNDDEVMACIHAYADEAYPEPSVEFDIGLGQMLLDQLTAMMRAFPKWKVNIVEPDYD